MRRFGRFRAPPQPEERPDEDERPCRGARGRRVLRLAGDLRPGPAAVSPPGIAHHRGHPGRAYRPGRAQVDARRRHRLHRARAARPPGLHPGGLLVLPLAVRPPGHGRDAALGPGEPGGRICVRRAASLLHAPDRAGPDPCRPEIQRRMAPRPFLGPAHAGPGLDHAAIRGLVRRAGPARGHRRRRRREQDARAERGDRGDLRLRQEGDGRRAPAADPQRRGPAVRAGARKVSGDLHAQRRVHRGDGAARRHDHRNSRA